MSSTNLPSEKFRLGMLLSDTRYRGTSLQVITFIIFVAVFFWLVDNTLKNLALLGKDVSFAFLGMRAGYDINQRLIPYTNDSTHAMAAFVGILNTLLCAFVGCIIATIVGVFVGILRLSKNWIIAKLMSVYIEGFRNVPVLLWIVMVFALLTEFTPAPKAFKGANPEATMFLFDSIAITNRGTYLPAPVWGQGSTFLIIIGYPTETWEDFLQTLKMFKKYRKYKNVIQNIQLGSTLGILPGTRLADEYKDDIEMNNGENFWIYSKNPKLDFKERIKRRIIAEEECRKMGYHLDEDTGQFKLLQYLWNIFKKNQKQNLHDLNTDNLYSQKYS